MKQIPLGIKIISVFYYISSALYFIASLMLLIGGSFFGSNTFGFFLSPSFFFLLALFCIALGILSIFIGRDLRRLKSWARKVAILFSIVAVLLSGVLIYLGILLGTIQIQNIIVFLINFYIVYYFGFNPLIKQIFTKS